MKRRSQMTERENNHRFFLGLSVSMALIVVSAVIHTGPDWGNISIAVSAGVLMSTSLLLAARTQRQS